MMSLGRKRRACWLAAALAIGAGGGWGGQKALTRTEAVFDFKEDGYFKTIPFIALQGDLFFISDNFNHRVLEYRLDGHKPEFLRAIGRQGQGPGDLTLPMEISAAGEALAVQDELGISLFGFDGTFQGKFPLLSKSLAMLSTGSRILSATCDPAKTDLIQVHDAARGAAGRVVDALVKKSSLYPLRYDIHRGLTPEGVERILFEGVLRRDGESVFYLNKRFGDVLQLDPAGRLIASRSVLPLLSKAEKAKADENRRLFLEEGFDLIKNQRMVPNHFLFEDAHIRNGRLYLLLGGFDLLERKPKLGTEIVEIDLASWKVVQTFRAAAASQGESASKLLVLGKAGNPAFLVTLRIPGDDPKLIVFTPER